MTSRAGVRQHPILSTEVVDADGKHRQGLRVFCDTRGQSVPLDVCRDCPSCIELNERGGEAGSWVRCTPPPELVPEGPAPSGRALRRGVVAVGQTVLVREIVALFVEHSIHMVVVTDDDGRVGGVVHESQLVRQIQDYRHAGERATRLGWEETVLEPASAIMYPAATILENVPLRTALAAMATAHQRQLLVIDEQGFPVGVLVDVDALHALHGRGD